VARSALQAVSDVWEERCRLLVQELQSLRAAVAAPVAARRI